MLIVIHLPLHIFYFIICFAENAIMPVSLHKQIYICLTVPRVVHVFRKPIYYNGELESATFSKLSFKSFR